MEVKKQHKCHDGLVQFWEHASRETRTPMRFSTFIPAKKARGCLIWLSGLTSNEENFMVKAAAQRYLADAGLMVICPDTSPRGLQLPGEHESWDFGSGASFYVDARTEGYRDHYRMESYITEELYTLIQERFEGGERISIAGHSMGGHGALVLGLRHPKKFRSLSAFAPIVNPSQCPWGQKAFQGYLGDDRGLWAEYDTCELLAKGRKHPLPLMIDQGTDDEFLEKQLLTENLVRVCEQRGQGLELKYRLGYDHNYYFISTFMERHINFHAKALS